MDKLIESLRVNLPDCKEYKDKFSVESFLKNLDCNNLSESDYIILDRLCKKVDVAKKVRSFYSSDLSKSAGDHLLTIQYVEYLCVILIYISNKTNEYKLLNTALKLIDDRLINHKYLENLVDQVLENI